MTTPLTKLIEENKERPIEEAPRDGTPILAKVDGNWDAFVVMWGNWTQEFGTMPAMPDGRIVEKDWILLGGEEYTDLQYAPTHFRPLPDDRLARCFEILLNAALSAKEQNHIYEAAADIEIALQEITAIAEGKDNA